MHIFEFLTAFGAVLIDWIRTIVWMLLIDRNWWIANRTQHVIYVRYPGTTCLGFMRRTFLNDPEKRFSSYLSANFADHIFMYILTRSIECH